MRPTTGITILGWRLGLFALAGYWIAMFFGTHWPAGVQLAPEVSDKIKHFTAYFGLGILCCYVTNSPTGDRRAGIKRFGGIFLGLAVYACVDEATQAFSPGRYPDVFDALADITGVATAIAFYLGCKTAFPSIGGHETQPDGN